MAKTPSPQTWSLPVQADGRRWSHPAQFVGVPTPAQPTLVSVTSSSATINGVNPGGAAATMHVYRDGVRVTTGVGVAFGNYTLTGLGASTTYSVRITAVNAQGVESAQSAARSVTTNAPGVAPLLAPSDFTYLGSFDVQTNGNDSSYDGQLALRRVGGQLRGVYSHFNSATGKGPLVEIAIPSTFGGTVSTTIRSWSMAALPFSEQGRWVHYWFEQGANRMWRLDAVQYPDSTYLALFPSGVPTVNISTMVLNDSGTIDNVRRVALQGVSGRRVFSGVLRMPESFRARHSLAPYLVGFGGHMSLVTAGGGVSMGASFFTCPDPAAYPASGGAAETGGFEIPAADFQVLANRGVSFSERGQRSYRAYSFTQTGTRTFTSAEVNQPGGNSAYLNVTVPVGTFGPVAGAEGPQFYGPLNYFDGGDPRGNPSNESMPDFLPIAEAQNPGGLAGVPDRALWRMADNYWGGVMFDGPVRRGLALLADLNMGRGWYSSSRDGSEFRVAELHIYDPEHFIEVRNGTRTLANLQPVTIVHLPQTMQPSRAGQLRGGVSMAWDEETKRLFVKVNASGPSVFVNRVFVYGVSA